MGATYKVRYKLSRQVQNELFIKFARALASLHGPEEAAQFMKDLLSGAEVFMLARRLQIAERLTEGWTYQRIREELKVSLNTIARVQTWLELYGEGYRKVIQRMGKKAEPKRGNAQPFGKLKRTYPMYFWPQLLLEELVKTANRKERERLMQVIGQLEEKSGLSRELSRILVGKN